MMQRLKKRDNDKKMRRVNYIEEFDEEEFEEHEEQLVLRVDGERPKQFYMERNDVRKLICKKKSWAKEKL